MMVKTASGARLFRITGMMKFGSLPIAKDPDKASATKKERFGMSSRNSRKNSVHISITVIGLISFSLMLLFGLVELTVAQTVPGSDRVQQPALAGSVEIFVPAGDPITIQRLDPQQAEIKIDGHLDEPAWAMPPVLEQMRVVEPDTLAVPPYKTEFRMFYTDEGIYVSFDMEQPADTIVKRFTRRDDFDVNRDNVSFTFDASGQGLYAYFMNLSLGDVQMDGTVKPERRFSREWDGAWYGATQITDKGWSAEYYVPWSLMAMPKVDGVRRIGIYITRKVAHLNERWSWPGLPESQGKFLTALQPLDFEGVDPRQQWAFIPYLSATHDWVDEDTRYKAGFDVFWRPSSNFQLTATVKPDFGAVEADDVVVNLTADETFFPEKRLFFLEGQDIFNTTPRSDEEFGQKLLVVNTRRIGARPRLPELPPGVNLPRREELRPTDLLGATKATGQVGSFRYGVLVALEDDIEFLADDIIYFQDGRDFATVRILYEDARGAAYRGLGFVSTLVAHPEADAMVHGIDFHRLSSDGSWDINGQLLYSDLDDKGRGFGGFTDIDYTPRKGLKHTLQLTVFDETIDINDFGFQVRNDAKDVRYALEWVQSDLSRVRDAQLNGFLRYAENWAGFRTNMGGGTNLGITLNNLHHLDIDLSYFPDRFDDRDSFGNGTFRVEAGMNWRIEYNTDTAKPLSVFGKVERRAEDLGGRSIKFEAGFSWRPRYNITLNLEASYLDRDGWLLHQEDRNFTTFKASQWEPALSFDFFASATQHFRLVLQWVGVRAEEDEFYTLEEGGTELIPGSKPPGPTDDFSLSQLSFQVRYRWQIAPLSDLFVVYTKADARRTELKGFSDLFRESWEDPLGDQLIVKLRYRFGS